MSAFADEIRNHPVLLALLNGLELQASSNEVLRAVLVADCRLADTPADAIEW
jgi:hypothetical protein